MTTGPAGDEDPAITELYAFRLAYNALLFSEWAAQGRYDVHLSHRHSDGSAEPGHFVVVAQTPFGQVSNHYRTEHRDLFDVPELDRARTWDGHTPQQALQRLLRTAALHAHPAPEPVTPASPQDGERPRGPSERRQTAGTRAASEASSRSRSADGEPGSAV